MVHKISEYDARWLSNGLLGKRTPNKKNNPSRDPSLAFVCVRTDMFGHTASTTDGYVLQVVDIAKEVDNGLYQLDVEKCELTLLENSRLKFPDWSTVVPDYFKFEMDTPLSEHLHRTLPIYEFPNKGKYDKSLVARTFYPRAKLRIRMNEPTRCIRIDIIRKKIKRQQFSLVMPSMLHR